MSTQKDTNNTIKQFKYIVSDMITREQLKAARVVVGISGKELAAVAGVGTVTVARYESGAGDARNDTLKKLKAVLEAKGVTFVGDNGISWQLPLAKDLTAAPQTAGYEYA